MGSKKQPFFNFPFEAPKISLSGDPKMSTAITATSSSTKHLLSPNQGANNCKIVSNGELINNIKADEVVSSDSTKAIGKEAEVKILNMKIESPGRPDIVVKTPYPASSPKTPLFTLKEGCLQQSKLEFVVSKDTVSGLRYSCEVWKNGIKVDHAKKMVGTLAPREEPYTLQLDQSRIPSGFFVRGNYTGRTRFVDDDGKCHFEETYYFDMQKEWGTQS